MNNVLLISCIHVHHNLYAYRNTLNEDIYDKHLKNIFVVVKCPALKKKTRGITTYWRPISKY